MNANPWLSEESITRRELELKRRRYALEFSVSDRVLMTESPRFLANLQRDYAYRLCVDLFCKSTEHVSELPKFTYPADWWQAFKARWFPRWLLRRYPVRTATVGGGWLSLDVHALFPDLKPFDRRDQLIIYTYDKPRIRL